MNDLDTRRAILSLLLTAALSTAACPSGAAGPPSAPPALLLASGPICRLAASRSGRPPHVATPSLSFDTDGLGTAIWRGCDGTYVDLLASHFDGQRWGRAETVATRVGGSSSDAWPIVSGARHEAAIGWVTDWAHNGPSQVATFDEARGWVASELFSGHFTLRHLGVGDDGTTYAIGEDFPAPDAAAFEVKQRRSGRTWTTAGEVIVSGAPGSYPELDVDPDGRVLATWSVRVHGGVDTSACVLRAMRLDVRTGLVSSAVVQPREFACASPIQHRSAVIRANTHGLAVAAWIEGAGPRAVFVSRLARDFSWTRPVAVGTTTTNVTVTDVQVAVDDRGEALVMWSTHDFAASLFAGDVWAARLDAQGRAGAPVRLGSGRDPAVAVDGDGNGLVVWQQMDRSGTSAGGAGFEYRFHRRESGWSEVARVPTAHGWWPEWIGGRGTVAADHHGHFFFTWSDTIAETAEIWIQPLTAP